MIVAGFSTTMAHAFKRIGRALRRRIGGMVQMYGPTRVIYHLGELPFARQQRVAFVYLSHIHNSEWSKKPTFHPNIAQHQIILHELLSMGLAVDVYNCSGDKPYNFPSVPNYDIILGFGQLYVQLCKLCPSAQKVLLVTENAPWVVREKFGQRMVYYHQRHKKTPYTILRTELYTDEMFCISDVGIAMTGNYNATEMRTKLSNLHTIGVNALTNPPFNDSAKDYRQARRHFVWFGSRGLIHKGLDILVDAFRQLPDCELSVYGAPRKELRGWDLPSNVKVAERLEVNSQQYVDEVVMRHAFVISLSCSEGMQTGIATCMMSGLIPVVTLETGYDECPYAIHFDDWHCDSVCRQIRSCSSMADIDLRRLSESCMDYAHSHFTDEAFQQNISDILQKILS